MGKIYIETELINNRTTVIIRKFDNVLTHKELPKKYLEHVPYMFKRDNWENKPIYINYVGGLEDIYIGSTYTVEQWDYLLEHINKCERKLHIVNHDILHRCPFCQSGFYNLAGLKNHLERYCDSYKLTKLDNAENAVHYFSFD